jgi:hypothetical protein
LFRCRIKRHPVEIISGIDICSLIQQKPGSIKAPLFTSKTQQQLSTAVSHIDVVVHRVQEPSSHSDLGNEAAVVWFLQEFHDPFEKRKNGLKFC